MGLAWFLFKGKYKGSKKSDGKKWFFWNILIWKEGLFKKLIILKYYNIYIYFFSFGDNKGFRFIL